MAEKAKTPWRWLLDLLASLHLAEWIAHGRIWLWLGGAILSAAGWVLGEELKRGDLIVGSVIGLAFCAALIVLALLLRWRRRLKVEGFIDALLYAFPPGQSKMSAAFEKRAYACLRIRNAGSVNLYKLVAGCFIDDAETSCFWSQTADGKFTRGGNVSEDLPVDHVRLLVIAQVYGDKKLWARLPADQEFLFHPNGIGSAEGQRIVSPAGEVLDFGAKGELKVRFRAEGLPKQVERFGLGFDAEGPTIAKL